jgi:hypothetical protein
MKKNILAENMLRFGTKNLSEQNLEDLENKLGFDSGANRDPRNGNLINPDSDINNDGYTDSTEDVGSDKRFADYIYKNYLEDTKQSVTAAGIAYMIQMDTDSKVNPSYIKSIMARYYNINLK